MNIVNILEEIEKVDGEIYERLSPRRAAMKQFYSFGSKVALASVPLALGSMFKKAYGQTNTAVIGVLNFALTLEYLEYHFYDTALGSAPLLLSGLTTGSPARGAITTIRDHELAHVNLLKGAISAAGGTPVAFTAAQFDFTARNTFPTVMSDYPTFLAVAAAFEDTGVRAYKGQAGNLMGSPYLETALNIHSVEARHASHIRQMRKATAGGGVNIKPWITGVDNTTGTPVAAIYAGEGQTVQANGKITITNINGTGISANAASEAFDEILTKEAVLAIAAPFIR
ncbi:ferritin-like domain-containing protein [Pedobacter sp. MC2016-14]|uniref:ferritin-like domain-containing protein n=1 Tax=Pedobacter sp. MC2016-14 TaxID=2897327 RepID=UPI001E545762|nr:ferritin-like domain-containing protein [Pedobacter sp. MC2016-14]MCD0489301.1 ferritin-like domain-containing protein [Pedobacter sp. MC2016-14]